MDTSTGAKTHRAALVVLPPEALWPPIQAFRRRHDRQHRRWPPHINLLYPFLAPAAWAQAQGRIRAVCLRQAPFELTLAGPRWFEHRPRHYTLWLAPEPAEVVVALHRALREAVPQCDDLDRVPGGYTPHLSVGQAHGHRALARLLEELRRTWTPASFRVEAVHYLTRGPRGTPEDVFRVRARVPLGRSNG